MKLLVFDMGHVFVDFEWEAVCHGFCRRAACTIDDLRPVFAELSRLGYESGRIGTDEFLSELNKRLGTDIGRDEFTQLFTHTFRENQHMAELLQKLKKQRPLYLLSNTNEVHYEWLQSNFAVARHFDALILSYKVGSSKPEETIYRHVLELSGMNASDCLFIDDLQANIDAAARVGMNTIHFNGVEPLKEELSRYGFAV
jgi:epoxide hydrolase-like predicted phosphatase